MQAAEEEYGKSFAFLKQHFVSHVIDAILTKCALQNQDTRPGEGQHIEVKQHYNRTDKRNVEPQVSSALV